jgi:hypothetical protein
MGKKKPPMMRQHQGVKKNSLLNYPRFRRKQRNSRSFKKEFKIPHRGNPTSSTEETEKLHYSFSVTSRNNTPRRNLKEEPQEETRLLPKEEVHYPSRRSPRRNFLEEETRLLF